MYESTLSEWLTELIISYLFIQGFPFLLLLLATLTLRKGGIFIATFFFLICHSANACLRLWQKVFARQVIRCDWAMLFK